MSFDAEDYYLPRKTKFLNNPLLVRPHVGSAKRVCGKHLSEKHTYGKVDKKDPEGAGQVVLTWKAHTPNAESIADPDFVAMNKDATMNGCLDPKSVADHRKSHLIRCKKGPIVGITEDEILRDRLRAMSFGKKTRPSTPMKELLSNSYQHAWIKEQKRYLVEEMALVQEKRAHAVADTKASLGHSIHTKRASGVTLDPKFKLSQFKDIHARVTIPKPDWYKKQHQLAEQQNEPKTSASDIGSQEETGVTTVKKSDDATGVSKSDNTLAKKIEGEKPENTEFDHEVRHANSRKAIAK
eukprot:43491_1